MDIKEKWLEQLQVAKIVSRDQKKNTRRGDVVMEELPHY